MSASLGRLDPRSRSTCLGPSSSADYQAQTPLPAAWVVCEAGLSACFVREILSPWRMEPGGEVIHGGASSFVAGLLPHSISEPRSNVGSIAPGRGESLAAEAPVRCDVAPPLAVTNSSASHGGLSGPMKPFRSGAGGRLVPTELGAILPKRIVHDASLGVRGAR